MNLDFRINNNDWKSSPKISLSEEHWDFVTVTKDFDFSLFKRFYDYYENGKIDANEIDSFLMELNQLEILSKLQRLKEIAKGLISLAVEAKMRKAGIKAWPD